MYDLVKFDFPLKQTPLTPDRYIRELHIKNQVVWHHTVSGRGVTGDVYTWQKDPRRIATSLIIDYYGIVNQCFATYYWASHLKAGNQKLDKCSIGIEIDSWGALVEHNNKYYPKDYIGKVKAVPEKNIQFYDNGFRGYGAFEKYSEAQIETARKVAIYLNQRYGIPMVYNEDVWDICDRALNGEDGFFCHVSYNKGKSDIHPQPEFIEMWKSLK